MYIIFKFLKIMEEKQNLLKVLLQENNIIVPSYLLYGGLSGFQDYGHVGLKIKNNLVSCWKKFFLNEITDNIFEIETPIIMPHQVLKASGHVDKFIDFIVFENDKEHRADHFAKDWFMKQNMTDKMNQVDNWTKEELQKNFNEFKIIDSPNIQIMEKNLMFELKQGDEINFLRPELAQGIFVNFHIFSDKKLPFGLAQVGNSFRKEICPKQFIRMRTFNQMEIEYFIDPKNKNHHCFNNIKNDQIPILSNQMQIDNNFIPKMIQLQQAIDDKIINSQTMCYFLNKIYKFAIKIGLKPDKIRFRQHLKTEMAHYANECWDLEALVNDNWLECVGCADRGDYDLKAHSKENNKLTVKRTLEKPIFINSLKIKPKKSSLCKIFKEKSPQILLNLENLEEEKILEFQKNGKINIFIDDQNFIQIDDSLAEIIEEKIKISSEDFFPHVIEPSFGIDRLIYSIFEQNIWKRPESEKRVVVSLPYEISPYQIAIFPLYGREDMVELVDKITKDLNKNGFTCYNDNSSVNIGKKYVRIDEIGIKFAITVDPGTLDKNNESVTIRSRDNMKQVKVKIDKILETLKFLY